MGCTNSNPKSSSGAEVKNDSLPLSSRPLVSDSNLVSNRGTFYQYLSDSVTQKLMLTAGEKNEVFFEYTVENNRLGCRDTIKGVAINKYPGQDPELDEDEEGIAYPSIEYVYKKGDKYLAIRVAMETEDMVNIKASGFNNGCNYESIGILRRVNDK